jgi:hypothetical protein
MAKEAKKTSKELPGLFRYHSPNIPMAAIRRHARRIAEKFDEIRGATSLGQNKPPLNDLICFHCQQSAEKYQSTLAGMGPRSASNSRPRQASELASTSRRDTPLAPEKACFS